MIQYFIDKKYSEKQSALLNYLIKRLGFDNTPSTKTYIEKLERVAHIFRNNRAIYDQKVDIPKYYYFDGEKYVPEKYNIIDLLIDEYSLKKNQKYKIIYTLSPYISATDLANYTFCPIGFSINNSFEIQSNKLAEIGERLHERARLISRIDFDSLRTTGEKEITKFMLHEFITETNKAFFDLLLEANLIFSGHNPKFQNEKKYFTNEDLKFIGQPDYVFKDKDGRNFIVEEKFKRQTEKNSNFFNNHKVQLASYIYYLNSFKAQYGYLVYWYYDYSDYKFNYSKCEVCRIDRGANVEMFLLHVYESVKEFRREKIYKPDLSRLNASKCASCVYCMYCGHKTGKLKEVALPYSRKHHVLSKAEYPEILKKKDDNTNEMTSNNPEPHETNKPYFIDNTPNELDHL